MQSSSLPVEAEFKRLAVCELNPLFRFVCFLTRDAERAADLIVDVYTQAFRRESLEEFNAQAGGMRVWLMALARTSLSERPENEYAGARAPGQAEPADHGGGFTLTPIPPPPPLPTNSDGVDVSAPSEVGVVDWANAGPRLSAGVDSMSEELREALWLWAMEGMNYREIGEVLLVLIETVMGVSGFPVGEWPCSMKTPFLACRTRYEPGRSSSAQTFRPPRRTEPAPQSAEHAGSPHRGTSYATSIKPTTARAM